MKADFEVVQGARALADLADVKIIGLANDKILRYSAVQKKWLATDDADFASTGDLQTHIDDSTNPHAVTKTQVGLGNVDNVQQIPITEKGAVSGVATLDGGGKVPGSQLPSTVMEYKGNWNPTTNTPTLSNGTGNAGDVYIASADGSHDFGAGAVAFLEGDWVVYDGSAWDKSINSNAVQSVNSKSGIVVLDKTDVGLTNVANVDTTNASNISSGTLPDARIGQTGVTQHQGALSITESQISDLGTYATDAALTAHTGDVSIHRELDDTITTTTNLWSAQKITDEMIASGAGDVSSVHGRIGDVVAQSGDYTKAQVGLGNVDNTSDLNKPISTATQTALNDKADDADVVKLTGAQTVSGLKQFQNGVSFTNAGETVYSNATGVLNADARSGIIFNADTNGNDAAGTADYQFRISGTTEMAIYNDNRIGFNHNRIVNIGTPTANDDAATKGYVDGEITTLDGTVVHTTGAENIGGAKTFTEQVNINSAGGANSAFSFSQAGVSKGYSGFVDFDSTMLVKGQNGVPLHLDADGDNSGAIVIGTDRAITFNTPSTFEDDATFNGDFLNMNYATTKKSFIAPNGYDSNRKTNNIIFGTQDLFAHLTKNGGTVTENFGGHGNFDNMFNDNRHQDTRWSGISAGTPLILDIDIGSDPFINQIYIGFGWRDQHAIDYVLEFEHDSDDNGTYVWQTAATVTDNNLYDVIHTINAWRVRAVRLTVTKAGTQGGGDEGRLALAYFQGISAVNGGGFRHALSTNGGDMFGNVDMKTNRITNSADPVDAQDLTTKAWVEANAGTNITEINGGTF